MGPVIIVNIHSLGNNKIAAYAQLYYAPMRIVSQHFSYHTPEKCVENSAENESNFLFGVVRNNNKQLKHFTPVKK